MHDDQVANMGRIAESDQRAAHRAQAHDAGVERFAELIGRGYTYEDALAESDEYRRWIIATAEREYLGGEE